MTPEEQRKFNKENEDLAIKIIKNLNWYQANKVPNKAAVLVEDILPIITSYVSRERNIK